MNRAGRFAAITAVTFDAGGTLLRPHPSVGVVYRDAARRHGAELDAAALERSFRTVWDRVSKSQAQLDPEARERDFWRRVVAATLAEVGAAPADFGAFFDDVWAAFARGAHWRLLPGAHATVAALRARGYRLAVLSNWDRRLHRVLEETGLRPLFDHVLISSEVGAEKPDVEIFRAAERALGASPADCLHVGDSRTHDFDGAHAAGWNALLLADAGQRADVDHLADADHTIRELSDLLALLPGPAGASARADTGRRQ